MPRRDLLPGGVEEEDAVIERLRQARLLDGNLGAAEGAAGKVTAAEVGGGGSLSRRKGAQTQAGGVVVEAMEGAGGDAGGGGGCRRRRHRDPMSV